MGGDAGGRHRWGSDIRFARINFTSWGTARKQKKED